MSVCVCARARVCVSRCGILGQEAYHKKNADTETSTKMPSNFMHKCENHSSSRKKVYFGVIPILCQKVPNRASQVPKFRFSVPECRFLCAEMSLPLCQISLRWCQNCAWVVPAMVHVSCKAVFGAPDSRPHSRSDFPRSLPNSRMIEANKNGCEASIERRAAATPQKCCSFVAKV